MKHHAKEDIGLSVGVAEEWAVMDVHGGISAAFRCWRRWPLLRWPFQIALV